MDKAENYYCFSEGLEGRVWTGVWKTWTGEQRHHHEGSFLWNLDPEESGIWHVESKSFKRDKNVLRPVS